MATRREGLARRRAVMGFTQETLAERLGIERSTVGRWERGTMTPLPWNQPDIAKALDLSPKELADLLRDGDSSTSAPAFSEEPETLIHLMTSTQNNVEGESLTIGASSNEPIRTLGALEDASQRVGDDVNRRTLFKLVGPAASLPVVEKLEHARRSLEDVLAISPNGRDADEWEQVAHEYACLVHVSHPLETLPLLVADFTDLCDTVARSKGATRARLASSAAQLAALSAIALGNVRHYNSARRWWGTARRTAETVGSPELSALIDGRHAVMSIYSATPEKVLELADKAIADGNGKPCAGVLMGLSARVQTLARQGRAPDALQALRQTVELSEKLRTDGPINENSQWTWTEQRLRFIESEVHSYAGRIDAAFQVQDAALANFPSSSFQGPTQIEVHRAIVLIRSGDANAGLNHLTQILGKLEQWQRSDGLVHQTVINALSYAPSGGRQRAQIDEIRGLIGANL